MAANNLDHADLSAIDFGGVIHEDVMNAIWDISDIPLPFTDSIGQDSVGNRYTSWRVDELAQPDITNAVVDGSDITQDDTKVGLRVGNQCQISVKRVVVSTRADAANTIAYAQETAYQLMQRQKELRRDRESIYLEPQASVEDDGNTTPGKLGGLPSWLTTNTSRGTGGADGGFANGIVSEPTPGQARGLTETMVRDIAESIYMQGGNASVMMSTPAVIRKFSEYCFTSSARIATLQRNEQGSGPGTALGTVNVFISDHDSTLRLVPNRLQFLYMSSDGSPVPVANVFILDPEYAREGILSGYRTEPQAKTGLSDPRQMHVDGTLKVLNEKAHGLIADIDPTVAVTT